MDTRGDTDVTTDRDNQTAWTALVAAYLRTPEAARRVAALAFDGVEVKDGWTAAEPRAADVDGEEIPDEDDEEDREATAASGAVVYVSATRRRTRVRRRKQTSRDSRDVRLDLDAVGRWVAERADAKHVSYFVGESGLKPRGVPNLAAWFRDGNEFRFGAVLRDGRAVMRVPAAIEREKTVEVRLDRPTPAAFEKRERSVVYHKEFPHEYQVLAGGVFPSASARVDGDAVVASLPRIDWHEVPFDADLWLHQQTTPRPATWAPFRMTPEIENERRRVARFVVRPEWLAEPLAADEFVEPGPPTRFESKDGPYWRVQVTRETESESDDEQAVVDTRRVRVVVAARDPVGRALAARRGADDGDDLVLLVAATDPGPLGREALHVRGVRVASLGKAFKAWSDAQSKGAVAARKVEL